MLAVVEDGEKLHLEGEQFRVSFCKESGFLIHLAKDGTPYLDRPLQPNFWRAITDNDRGNRLQERSAVWRQNDTVCLEFALEEYAEKISVCTKLFIAQSNTFIWLTYHVYADGEIKVA